MSESDEFYALARELREGQLGRGDGSPEMAPLLAEAKAFVSLSFDRLRTSSKAGTDDESNSNARVEVILETLVTMNALSTSLAAIGLLAEGTEIVRFLCDVVLREPETFDGVLHTIPMLDALDLLSKMSQHRRAAKKMLRHGLIEVFANHLLRSFLKELESEVEADPEKFRALVEQTPADDVQAREYGSERRVASTSPLLCYQKLCGALYVFCLRSDAASRELLGVPALTFAMRLIGAILKYYQEEELEASEYTLPRLEVTNTLMASALAVLLACCRTKGGCVAVVEADALQLLGRILSLFIDQVETSPISVEVGVLTCALLTALFASPVRAFEPTRFAEVKFHHALLRLMRQATRPRDRPIYRCALSSLTEILTVQGSKNVVSTIQYLQTAATPPCETPDELFMLLRESLEFHTDDSEAMLFFAVLVHLLCGKGRRDGVQSAMRERMLQERFGDILLDAWRKHADPEVKRECILALAALVNVRRPTTQVFFTVSSRATDYAVQFNRENKYPECRQACKELLRALGHRDGMDRVQGMLYGLLFTGCGLGIVLVVRLAIAWFVR
ncbi:hypothetical protein GMRT_11314 [Giardia muris]|uniref:Uncharacterized protein n=1 Tax=Giardia muris TaxID=5742 RepID=A0A4Z1SLV0_GIAMU|nr:hypothetical protein GMRT_11314 [Giardia muris]|eukprot:TNJ26634.1 hypothetical protein GMRT_11314 [Giardia muris]